MVRKKRQFPLVADEELVISSPPRMELYDNKDLINNIHGDYAGKTYPDNHELISQEPTATAQVTKASSISQKPAKTEEKSYAEIVREQAKQDLKRKRQTQIAQETKIPSKLSFQRRKNQQNSDSQLPTAFFNGRKANARHKEELPTDRLTRLSRKLHQESYILAELPKVYHEPSNPSAKKHTKNNYDFLKRSQIYNQKETQERRSHQIAKELNLMFDSEY